jgi:hypothetical protein
MTQELEKREMRGEIEKMLLLQKLSIQSCSHLPTSTIRAITEKLGPRLASPHSFVKSHPHDDKTNGSFYERDVRECALIKPRAIAQQQ